MAEKEPDGLMAELQRLLCCLLSRARAWLAKAAGRVQLEALK